jgi:small subunit ribosomal protein S2
MEFTIEKRIAAGIHLGHPVRYWNPKIISYTYGIRNGIRLIDLVKTYKQLKKAEKFLELRSMSKNHILFIGTKSQAAQHIKSSAQDSQSFFVRERWLGGILTNWSTVQISLLQLHRLERAERKDSWNSLSKKDVSLLRARLRRLERYFGGLKGIRTIPDVRIVVGQIAELVAVRECYKLKIPIVCRLDTDCDPNWAEIGVPINDDSSRRIFLFLESLCSRIKKGHNLREHKQVDSLIIFNIEHLI